MKLLGEEMTDKMQRAIVLDFDHGIFLGRKMNPIPFEHCPKEMFQNFTVVDSKTDFANILSIEDDENEVLKSKMIQSIQTTFCLNEVSCSLTDIDSDDLPGIPTTDLFSALAEAMHTDPSYDVDELKRAIVLEIQTRQHDPNPAWKYDPDLEASLGRYLLFEEPLTSKCEAYAIAWCCHLFKCSICMWTVGKNSPIVFPCKHKKYSRLFIPGNCHHLVMLGTVSGKEGKQFHCITKRISSIPMNPTKKPETLRPDPFSKLETSKYYLSMDTSALMRISETKDFPFLKNLEENHSEEVVLFIPYVVWREELDGLKKSKPTARDIAKFIQRKSEIKPKFWNLQDFDSDDNFVNARVHRNDLKQVIPKIESVSLLYGIDICLHRRCCLLEKSILGTLAIC